jgi:hypothetical protein
MGNYILVPLNPSDQVEEIIPRIEKVAQDGITVIFLIPYQASGLFESRRIKAELLAKGMLTDKKALMKYSYEKQTRLAGEKTAFAGEALHQRGINVITYVYVGPLRRLLKSYKRNGGVHRVLLPRGNATSMIGFLRGTIALFSSLKRLNSLPHLYHCREI